MEKYELRVLQDKEKFEAINDDAAVAFAQDWINADDFFCDDPERIEVEITHLASGNNQYYVLKREE